MDSSSHLQLEELLVHGAWLRRLASSLVATEGDAEDLVQETWLAALVRGPARREEARAWLARVLRNKAISRARKLGARHGRELAAARPEDLPSAADLAGRADVSRRLVGFVLELPRESQRILLAHYYEGLSSAEIARRLGWPDGTVRSKLKRGLDELRIRLDAENGGDRERWLGALSPLFLPRSGESLLGVALAGSALVPTAVCLGVAILAATGWWMNRASEPSRHTDILISRADGGEPEPAEVVPAKQGSLAANQGEQRVELEGAQAIYRSVIEGRVVHPETSEAVVWFELGIVPAQLAPVFEVEVSSDTQIPEPKELEVIRTDEKGRFVSSSEYANGSYAIVPVEDWREARTKVDQSRIRQPRSPLIIEHDATAPESHLIELETGAVFVVDCAKALELGADSMVAIYSYRDHFPPEYFRPSHLQTEPVPFIRMYTDFDPAQRSRVSNLRLVSEDGFWSGSVPMEVPESIATQHVSFDLQPCARVAIDLDFGGRKPPPFVDLHYWKGAVDPTMVDAPEPDIVEVQGSVDGTKLEEALVKYLPTGLGTVGIKASTFEHWFQVLDLPAGHTSLEAELLSNPAATGRIEGRLVYVGEKAPEQLLRVVADGVLDGEPTFPSLDLEFRQESGQWVAEFVFTHLPTTTHTLWFDRRGPTATGPKAFAVVPSQLRVDTNGPPVEFELHTDLASTSLRVKVRDESTGDEINDFAVTVFVPDAFLQSDRADSKAGRATLDLVGSLDGGFAILGADGYIRRDVPLSEAVELNSGLELEVELTRGWGGPVYVKQADTYQPLAGVRVLLDGAPFGVTNEAGLLLLEAPTAPGRVDFELDGYEVVSQTGWVDSEGQVIPVDRDPISQFIGVFMRK